MKRTPPGTRLFGSLLFGANASGIKLLGSKLFGATLIAGTLSCADALSAEPLGRLFFTPTQRNALDSGKRIGEPPTRAREPRGPREIRLNGIVTRSDGESTIWINGSSLSSEPRSELNATASSSDPAVAQVEPRGLRKPVRVRVGQRVDAMTGKVTEAYGAPLYPVSISPLATDSAGRAADTTSASLIQPHSNATAPSGDGSATAPTDQ